MRRTTVHYSGHVQGVNFRSTARRIAREHSVVGYVENLSDGRVRLVAEGEEEAVRRYLDSVRSAMGGKIADVDEHEGEATGEFDGFDIRY